MTVNLLYEVCFFCVELGTKHRAARLKCLDHAAGKRPRRSEAAGTSAQSHLEPGDVIAGGVDSAACCQPLKISLQARCERVVFPTRIQRAEIGGDAYTHGTASLAQPRRISATRSITQIISFCSD